MTASQLSARAGLVRCGDCGAVFNAAWSLEDEIPNPAETATPVAQEPMTSSSNSRPRLKISQSQDSGPGFADGGRLFTLDDQLRHDLQLGADGDQALEEIRQTLGPTDVGSAPRERWIMPFLREKRSRTRTADRLQHEKFEPVTKTPLIAGPLQTGRRETDSFSGRRRPGPTIFWLLATVTVLFGLFIQVRYVLFDELAVIPSARAPLETFCGVVNCSVPAPLTGPMYRVLQTRVDLDPQLPGAVVVKVHLVNRTPTPRTYPPIQLTLTNRDGEVIGRRTYFAQDYGQDTVGDRLTPGLVAVVTLHLADPDENAVGFEATIVETST